MAEDEVGSDPRMMTTAMLKAFANPLRRRIAMEFNRQKHLRASDIAASLGEPVNKVSFHLRVLADAGLIVEAPEHARDRRDRVWTAGVEGSLNVAAEGRPAEDPILANAVARGMADDHQLLLARVMQSLPDYLAGREEESHGFFSTSHLVLTADEFTAMMRRIDEVINGAKDAHGDGAEGSRLFHMDIIAAADPV